MVGFSESRVKFLIISIFVLFLIQEIVIYNFVSEPYPALRMPPFSGNNMNEEGFYETTSVEIEIIFDGQDQMVLTPTQFFYDAPISHHWVLASTFKPSPEIANNKPHQRLEVLKSIMPGFFISRQRSDYEVQRHPETIEWLNSRVKSISPNKTPQSIIFNWYRDQYNLDNLLQRERELTGTTKIEM